MSKKDSKIEAPKNDEIIKILQWIDSDLHILIKDLEYLYKKYKNKQKKARTDSKS